MRPRKLLPLLLLALILLPPVHAQTSYVLNSTVTSVTPSGTGQDVLLANGETVFCAPDGLLGRLCPLLAIGDAVAFNGEFPTSDSDLGMLGNLGADEMTVADGNAPLFFFPDMWTFDGCVQQVVSDGAGGHFLTLEFGQVERLVACDSSGALGALCDDLLVGDCAVFRGTFGAPLDLVEMTVDATVPAAGGGGPCGDVDCDDGR